MNAVRIFSRKFSVKCTSLIYNSTGDPVKVLQKIETNLPDLKDSEVLVEMIAAPINPADINMIQGVYAIKPQLPAIGGNEGVARVVRSKANSFKVGDSVIPTGAGFGTWRTHAVCGGADILKIDPALPVESAATMFINPTTAYRMLKDFVTLTDGDVIIQNGANSAVGQAVIQMSRFFGWRTVNIIRNRPNSDALVEYLKSIGATHVIVDDSIRSESVKDLMSQLPKPKLGLNTVGGKSAADVVKYLETGGTLVTYGGMSKQPAMIPTGSLIFTDVRIRGFWMSKWTEEHRGSPEQVRMFSDITGMVKSKALSPPLCDKVPFRDFELAIRASMQPLLTRKQILIF